MSKSVGKSIFTPEKGVKMLIEQKQKFLQFINDRPEYSTDFESKEQRINTIHYLEKELTHMNRYCQAWTAVLSQIKAYAIQACTLSADKDLEPNLVSSFVSKIPRFTDVLKNEL